MAFEMIKIKPGEDLSPVLPLRQEIFGNGEDELDEIGISIVLKDEGEPVACGRVVLDIEDDRIIIEQIGVKEDRRRRHIGTEVLEHLMDIARECGSVNVWAKTRMNFAAEEMLEKHGFEQMNSYWMEVETANYK